ncbi:MULTISPECIES: hypothetical protein [Deinococcus]|nr:MULTISPECIES: hypothetical protein [Deinococcus]
MDWRSIGWLGVAFLEHRNGPLTLGAVGAWVVAALAVFTANE